MYLTQLRRAIGILLLFFLTSGLCRAQVEGISIISAENYYKDKDYRNALVGFEEYLSNIKPDRDIAFRAGICATRLGIGKKAISHLTAARSGGLKDRYFTYWMGRAFLLDEQWDSARVYLTEYLDVFPIDKSYKKEAQKFIREIEIAQTFKSAVLQPYVIDNLGSMVNSVYSEYHPMLTHDGNMLVYTSRKKGFPEEKILDDGEYKEKIFISRKQPDGTWGRGVPIRLVEGRNKDVDYQAVQLIDDNTRLLLYKVAGDKADLFISEYNGEGWKLPYKIPIVPDPRFFTGDIIFSKDLKSVIFSTNGNTNNFQTDLYTSRYNDKTETWSEPVFLGKNINSGLDEASPFMPDEKTLIFSSKSDKGIGDFDLYRSVWDEKSNSWGDPENLGFPFNTPNNDLYYYLQNQHPDVRYFSSIRGTTRGQSDLYRVRKTELVTAGGTITDENGLALVSSEVDFVDPENYQNLKMVTDASGRFAGQVVAGQKYLVQFRRNRQILEGHLSIPFPVAGAVLSDFRLVLKPKGKTVADSEAGGSAGE